MIKTGDTCAHGARRAVDYTEVYVERMYQDGHEFVEAGAVDELSTT